MTKKTVIPMQNAYVVTGTLTDSRTVTLDEALPLGATKVRLVVEPLGPVAPCPLPEVMAAIRERQRQRGHKPPTPEEVGAHIEAERDSWGD